MASQGATLCIALQCSPPLDAQVLQDGPDADEHAEAHDEPPQPLAVRAAVHRQVVLDAHAAAAAPVVGVGNPVNGRPVVENRGCLIT